MARLVHIDMIRSQMGERRSGRESSRQPQQSGIHDVAVTNKEQQQMIVVGLGGEEIGRVERFEIDQSGRLKSLVVGITSSLGIQKRIAVEQIRSIQDGIVHLALSAAEISRLDDARELEPEDILFLDHTQF